VLGSSLALLTWSIGVPGVTLDAAGLRFHRPDAERWEWSEPVPAMRPEPKVIGGRGYVGASRAYLPGRIFVSEVAPGWDAHFAQGLRLRLRTNAPPQITWAEATAGANVPTPAVRWVLITAGNQQPPLMLGLPEGATTFTVKGRPADWRIETPLEFRGWVRMTPATGTQPVPSETAADFGRLADLGKRLEPVFTSRVPRLVEQTFAAEGDHVRIAWRFDRPGVRLPQFFAQQKGRPAIAVGGIDEQGPIVLTPEAQIAVTLRSPGLAPGVPVRRGVRTVGRSDAVGYAALLEFLLQQRGDTAELPEPPGAGSLAPEVGALYQRVREAVTQACGARPAPAAPWEDLGWISGLSKAESQDDSRRGAALLAVAGMLTDDPAWRALGAWAHVSLGAARRQGSEPAIEPMWRLREAVYGTETVEPDPWWESLRAPARLAIEPPGSTQMGPGADVRWSDEVRQGRIWALGQAGGPPGGTPTAGGISWLIAWEAGATPVRITWPEADLRPWFPAPRYLEPRLQPGQG
jgi:hypothetical protein